MQWLVELIAGFVALLAASALSQIGVDFSTPRQGDREVRRVSNDCSGSPAKTAIPASKREC
jgi:hypothetical protein